MMPFDKDNPQFDRGKKVETFLDAFFRRQGWRIEQTSAYEERVLCLGDRRFIRDGKTYLIEYKSGIQTFYTGNVFLETISVDTQNKAGWIYTCQADYIFYAALLNHKILIFKPQRLRDEIELLKERFPEKPTSKNQNAGYNTHGVCVPLPFAEQYLVEKVISL